MKQKPASWIIREKATGKVLCETFSEPAVKALNTSKYEAVPVLEYLQGLNSKQKRLPPAAFFAVREVLKSNGEVLDVFLSESGPDCELWEAWQMAADFIGANTGPDKVFEVHRFKTNEDRADFLAASLRNWI